METVTLTIDGRQITVEKGKTVLQAAVESGIAVPYYCYHPGIGIDGSCRVCIVRIEKMPKLQTSCSTVCADGMVVHTRTDDVVAARAGVFEFLLVNHPLDCPVCDKGGECPLQDFSYTFGPDQSRMEFPRRTFDGEGVQADVDFGPTLMLNRNRCILCTRCVRFMRDVEGDAQINIIDRGYGSEIATFQEEGVHSLISGNLMDVCPVGAITTRDYRFKSRPWDNPNAVDTVCTLCSKGCSTTAWLKAKPEWAKGSQLVRFTPRFNPDVNGYWMCDIGRFDYHWIEADDRLRRPLLRDARGHLQPAAWHDLLPQLVMRLSEAGRPNPDGVRFLLSAHASLEELFLFKRLTQELAGEGTDVISVSWRVTPKAQPAGTTFRVPEVDAPNVHGAHVFGLERQPPHRAEDLPIRGEVSASVRGGGARLRQGYGAPEARENTLSEGWGAPPQVSNAVHTRHANNQPDIAALKQDVAAGRVTALYVFDPGPEGSIGDMQWILDARSQGRLPLLVVQGVLLTALAQAADFVLPGASFVEKDASYINDQGRLQATSRAIAAPGEALEDWHVLTRLAAALGLTFDYESSADVRRDIATAHPDVAELEGISRLAFGSVVPGHHWLQASNPSERWKWDFMFQDLPPVKGTVDPSALPLPPGAIPLKEIKA